MRWFRRVTVLRARRGPWLEDAPWIVYAPSVPGKAERVIGRFTTHRRAFEFAAAHAHWYYPAVQQP